MKIEKINDNQLRFTLTREDLSSRQIKLSELAYGSEKAKSLFRDMMQQAAEDFGFEANNMPLMVEAIPVSSDSIVLIVTRVDDPEELDSRFARFSADDSEAGKSSSSAPARISAADDILDLISKLEKARKSVKKDASEATAQGGASGEGNTSARGPLEIKKDSGINAVPVDEKPASPANTEEAGPLRLNRFYLFHDLQTVIRAAHMISEQYTDHNSLFKNKDDGNYYLIVRMTDTDPKVFNSVCNILSEYAMQVDFSNGMEQFFTEHMQVIRDGQALQDLKML